MNCSSGFAGIGQTWSTPNVASLKIGGTAAEAPTQIVAVGGGYDSCEDGSPNATCGGAKGSIVYILRADDGRSSHRSLPTGRVVADVAFVDLDSDGIPDLGLRRRHARQHLPDQLRHFQVGAAGCGELDVDARCRHDGIESKIPLRARSISGVRQQHRQVLRLSRARHRRSRAAVGNAVSVCRSGIESVLRVLRRHHVYGQGGPRQLDHHDERLHGGNVVLDVACRTWVRQVRLVHGSRCLRTEGDGLYAGRHDAGRADSNVGRDRRRFRRVQHQSGHPAQRQYVCAAGRGTRLCRESLERVRRHRRAAE